MSLPSLSVIIDERKLGANLSGEELESVLAEAMRRDLPLGVAYLHKMAHRAIDTKRAEFGNEDPNSALGKQLIRICAGTVLRSVAEKHFCHGLTLAFLNCCGPIVGPEKEMPDKKTLMRRQVHMQDGTLAHADC